jgi:DNA-binding response OmpR family regulator
VADVCFMEMERLGEDRVRSRDPGVRILLADHENRARHTHRRILERAGYECVEAGGSAEARRRLQEDDVALVLVDASMSCEAGLELACHVLAKYAATTVIMITDRDDAGLAEGALASGACGYLVRPFTPSELITVVANALCRRALGIEKDADQETVQRLGRVRTAAHARSAEAFLSPIDEIVALRENGPPPTVRA